MYGCGGMMEDDVIDGVGEGDGDANVFRRRFV